MSMLQFEIETANGAGLLETTVARLIIAGWAGRDKAAMEHHIAELEALGVKRPAATPTYYHASASRLTTAGSIEVLGEDSSGEVEPFYLMHDGELYVGVGSDHTDRTVETYGISVSKQMCEKPVAARLWRHADVAGHWDQLILRSFATIGGERVLYQEGTVAMLLAPADVIAGYEASGRLAEQTAMLGGTLSAIGGIRSASLFEGELEDPVLGRRIGFSYAIESLPISG